MAFDFPENPAVGDEYVSGGATYTWTGIVWDLGGMNAPADFVEKTGDTMTGVLNFTAGGVSPFRAFSFKKSDGAVTDAYINLVVPAAEEGILEFWTANGGYSSNWTFKTTIGTTPGINVNGNASVASLNVRSGAVNMGDGAGLLWGNTSAKSSHTDLSEGICMYGWGSTSKFGFNVTSGTLGYCVENVGNRHCFTVGNVERFIINKDGAYNTSGHFRTGEVDGLGIRMYGSAYIYKKIGTGMVMRRSANNVQWQTEMNDGSGTTPVATASMTTFKDMGLALPELKSDAELKPFARKDEGIEGFDVAKLITLMLKKIRALEAKCAQLEKRK